MRTVDERLYRELSRKASESPRRRAHHRVDITWRPTANPVTPSAPPPNLERSKAAAGGTRAPPPLSSTARVVGPNGRRAQPRLQRGPPMRLRDAAKVIRSKNAGPTEITVDLMFNDAAGFARAPLRQA